MHHFEEHHMLLGQELIEVFNPDVVILFDCGAGEMLKATLAQRVVSVGIVPNKTHKDLLMGVLRKFVEAMNLVNMMDGPTKPLPMIKFEADHPDNDDVRKSVANMASVTWAGAKAKAAEPPPSTPKASMIIGGSPQTPRTPPTPAPAPKLMMSTPGSAASSSQASPPQKTLLQFGTTIL